MHEPLLNTSAHPLQAPSQKTRACAWFVKTETLKMARLCVSMIAADSGVAAEAGLLHTRPVKRSTVRVLQTVAQTVAQSVAQSDCCSTATTTAGSGMMLSVTALPTNLWSWSELTGPV